MYALLYGNAFCMSGDHWPLKTVSKANTKKPSPCTVQRAPMIACVHKYFVERTAKYQAVKVKIQPSSELDLIRGRVCLIGSFEVNTLRGIILPNKLYVKINQNFKLVAKISTKEIYTELINKIKNIKVTM